MAKDKNSFLLYSDVIHTVNLLTDEQAGQLFKHLLAYVNDKEPVLTDVVLQVAFEPIRLSLKRDLKKYEQIRAKRSEAGKASAALKQQMLTHVNKSEQSSTNSTVSVSVSVNDSDSVINNNRPFRPDFLKLPEWMREPLKLWIKHKKEKKSNYKETGFNQLVDQIKKDYPGGRGFFDAVRHSISNNYQGIYPKSKEVVPPTMQPKLEEEY